MAWPVIDAERTRLGAVGDRRQEITQLRVGARFRRVETGISYFLATSLALRRR